MGVIDIVRPEFRCDIQGSLQGPVQSLSPNYLFDEDFGQKRIDECIDSKILSLSARRHQQTPCFVIPTLDSKHSV